MIDLMFRRFCLRLLAICGILRTFSLIFLIFPLDSAREVGYNISRRAVFVQGVGELDPEGLSDLIAFFFIQIQHFIALIFSVIFRIFTVDSAREIGYNVSRRAIFVQGVIVLYFEALREQVASFFIHIQHFIVRKCFFMSPITFF